MPFAVFRKHQRKLIAIFAILAMFAFVAGRFAARVDRRIAAAGAGAARDPVVAKLNWKTVRLQRPGADAAPAPAGELLPVGGLPRHPASTPSIFGGV